jgi:cation transport protein ChaC
MIAGATGLSGRNVDYLRDLVEHLQAEGIRDRSMEALLGLVEAR